MWLAEFQISGKVDQVLDCKIQKRRLLCIKYTNTLASPSVCRSSSVLGSAWQLTHAPILLVLGKGMKTVCRRWWREGAPSWRPQCAAVGCQPWKDSWPSSPLATASSTMTAFRVLRPWAGNPSTLAVSCLFFSVLDKSCWKSNQTTLLIWGQWMKNLCISPPPTHTHTHRYLIFVDWLSHYGICLQHGTGCTDN